MANPRSMHSAMMTPTLPMGCSVTEGMYVPASFVAKLDASGSKSPAPQIFFHTRGFFVYLAIAVCSFCEDSPFAGGNCFISCDGRVVAGSVLSSFSDLEQQHCTPRFDAPFLYLSSLLASRTKNATKNVTCRPNRCQKFIPSKKQVT